MQPVRHSARTTLLLASVLALLPFTAQSEDIKLGVLVELSGTNAANGRDCLNGVEVARDLFLPKTSRIRFIVGDHAGDPKRGISEFRRVVELEHVLAVLTTRSQVGMPLNPLSRQTRTALLGSVGHPRFVSDNPYAFRFYPRVEREAQVLAAAARHQNFHAVSTLTAEDEWTEALNTAFENEWRAEKGQLPVALSLAVDQSDLSPIVSRLKAGAPDAILINLTLAQAGLAIKKLRQQGYGGAILTNFWGVNPNSIAAAGVDNMEGVIVAELNLKRPKFVQRFNTMFPRSRASSVTYVCFTAAAAMIHGAKALSPTAGKDDLYNRLRGLSSLSLPDETVMLRDREAQLEVVPHIMRGGQPVDLN